ncbi:hypothetical protein V6N13_135325 [Hibiscus sabdariffa]
MQLQTHQARRSRSFDGTTSSTFYRGKKLVLQTCPWKVLVQGAKVQEKTPQKTGIVSFMEDNERSIEPGLSPNFS